MSEFISIARESRLLFVARGKLAGVNNVVMRLNPDERIGAGV
jgi:hypothetical protein